MNRSFTALSLIILVSCGNGSVNLEGSYSLDLETSPAIIDAKKAVETLEVMKDRGREPDAQARYERSLENAKQAIELLKIAFNSINIDKDNIFKWDSMMWCKVIEIDVPKGVKCEFSREELLEQSSSPDLSYSADIQIQIQKTQKGLKVIDFYEREFNFVKK